jgi:hypothetical protein
MRYQRRTIVLERRAPASGDGGASHERSDPSSPETTARPSSHFGAAETVNRVSGFAAPDLQPFPLSRIPEGSRDE